MENLEKQRLEDIKQIKNLIKTYGLSYDFDEYAAFYYFTNEQINKIFSQIDFSNFHNSLCVLSSGDHAFNAIYKGIDIVDTFDVNRLTEYYALGFKKRAIECLNFEQFCSLFSLKKQKLMDLEDEVIKNMEEEYKKFWENYKYEMKCRKEKFPSVLYWSIGGNRPEGGYYNAYLDNETAYKYFQKRLESAKITFTQADITELPTKFGSYDFIELSNILAYNDKIFERNLKYHTSKLITEMFDNNLNNNGTMIYQTRNFDPLSPLFTPLRLKRSKRHYTESDDYVCVFGLQKGTR